MKRKLSAALSLVLLASLLITTAALAAKSYYAERFDVQIDIQKNGSAIVTETIEFHFSGDPFTYAFRNISAKNTDGITFLDASLNGTMMPQGTQAGQVEVKSGDPLKVTWHFSPTSDAAHVLTLRYQADGVIRKDGADTIVWSAIPEDHDYRINHSTITLTYPPEVAPLGQPALDWNHDARWEDARVILTASGLAEDQPLTLTAHFPLNALTGAAPQWQVRRDQAAAAASKALPIGFGAGIAALILGALGLFGYARANTRELNLAPVVSNPNPPSNLPAALIGKLTGQEHIFMGAIFDLAQRGVLEVQEEPRFLGTKSHVLVHGDAPASLQLFEQELLEALFKSGEDRVSMNAVATRLASRKKSFEEPLEQELIRRGWLDPERMQKRTWLAAAGLLVMILSILAFILALVVASVSARGNPAWLAAAAAAAGISAAVFVLSIPLIIYGSRFSALTPAGEEQAAHWKGFAEYIRQVSKGNEPATRPDYFEKYLAYAAVFGLGGRWARYFHDLGGVPLPVWFHAMAGSDGDFAAMVAIMSASDSAGASAGAGAAAASGGGSSGAG